MPRRCTVCNHPEREGIDKALVAGDSSNCSLASLFGVSEAAIRRHKAAHLSTVLVKAQEAADMARADDLLGQVRDLQGRAIKLLEGAEAAGDRRTALMGIREARGCLELQGRLVGELREQQTTVNVLVASQEWLTLRTAILRALEPYPEARLALAQALEVAGVGK